MVAHKRSLYPLCSFLRMLAVEHGLAQCDVESHLLSVERKPSAESWILHRVCSMLECLKTCTFAVFGSCNFWIPFVFSVPFLKDGQESVEVSFRWAISPLASMKSHVFKPNAPGFHFAGSRENCYPWGLFSRELSESSTKHKGITGLGGWVLESETFSFM